MSIITLITDWGTDGAYVGAFKGAILQKTQNLNFIDIAHNIKPYDKIHAAYILRNTYNSFPKGSIHIICVGGNQDNPKTEFVVFEMDNHYFIGKNDGIWGLVFNTPPSNIRKLNLSEKHIEHAFVELSLIPEIINQITLQKSVDTIGEPFTKLIIRNRQLPAVTANTIIGEIAYFDNFGNAVTNISKDDFERIHKGRKHKIQVASIRNNIFFINSAYDETERGDILAIWNYTGFLEIAIADGSAQDLLNLTVTNSVRIVFTE